MFIRHLQVSGSVFVGFHVVKPIFCSGELFRGVKKFARVRLLAVVVFHLGRGSKESFLGCCCCIREVWRVVVFKGVRDSIGIPIEFHWWRVSGLFACIIV